jgi:hypothetical protein
MRPLAEQSGGESAHLSSALYLRRKSKPSHLPFTQPTFEMSGKQSSSGGKPMTGEAASRIQSAEARGHEGQTEKGGFATRAQSAAAKNEPSSQQQQQRQQHQRR